MFGISITRSILACACVAAALAGCEKAEAPPTPAVESPSSTSSSVAAPSEAMPPSEAAIPVQPPTNGDTASGPAQSTPNELSKEQESSAMPLPGQANNHSTVTPEK